MSNPFYDPEDVDDDEFLNHPRAGNSGYVLPQHHNRPSSGVNPVNSVDPRQQFLQKKREIEERTLESSNRSLGLLFESEKVGQATAEELARQKEQLKSTESRLDDINSTLKQSERHLNGIKSVFGGIRNYFAGRNATAAAPGAGGTRMHVSQSESSMAKPLPHQIMSQNDDQRLDSMRNASHPGLRVRDLDDTADLGSSKHVDDILDRNLDEMSLGLNRLKGLAINLNQELDEHDEILTRLDDKTAFTHMKVQKQNKDMNKILKK